MKKVVDIRKIIPVNDPDLFDSRGVPGPRPNFRTLDEAVSFYEAALLGQHNLISLLQKEQTPPDDGVAQDET